MTNLYQRNRLRPRVRAVRERGGWGPLLVAIILIALVIAIDAFLSGAIRSAGRSVLAPVAQFVKAAAGAITGENFWSSRQSVLEENMALRQQIEKMRARDLGYDALLLENDSLRRMMNLPDAESGGMTAPVISSFRASPYGTFLIGVGRSGGIREGSIALSEGGFVLGVVSEVSNNSSLVTMVFAPGQDTDVVVDSVGFELRGRGAGNASAQVPSEAALSEHALVLAPKYESRPVGMIGKIESASSSAYADVHVVFPLNLNTIRYVYVVPGT